MTPTLRAVMFDLDGTLVDTMGAFADVAADVMVRLHGADRAVARRRYLETSGIPFRQQLEVIHPGHASNQLASDTFESEKRAACDATMMDADSVRGLAALRELGLKLIISSNADQHFVDDFARREVFQFDLVLGFDRGLGRAKGRPHVEHTCRALALETSEILFCGDSIKDAELARDTGLSFVGRLGTFTLDDFRRFDPDAVAVSNVVELPKLLRARKAA